MLFAPLFLLIGAAQALPWDGANPTKHAELPLRYDEPPKPTEAVDLRKRQEVGDITCAWENGQVSSFHELYCASQHVCATNSLGVFGCCASSTLDDCWLYTTCIDSTAVADYSSSYGYDPYAILCTLAQNPICITELIELANTVSGWICSASSNAKTQTFYSTTWNATAASTQIPASFHNAVFASYSPLVLKTTSQSSTTASTASPTAAAPTTTPSSTETSTPTPTPTPAASSSVPIGAIVGGVIGGVAVIGGLALLAFFLFRRSKQQNNIQPPYTGGAAFMQQPPYTGGAAPMQQSHGPPPPIQSAQYPVQSEYIYGSQPPAQQQLPTDPQSYPEKLPAQGSPQMSSHSPMGQDLRASNPLYSPTTSEIGPSMRDSTAGTRGPVHELGE